MKFGLGLYAGVITLFLIIFIWVYILHKRQIRTLREKLKYIQQRTSHIQLTVDFPSKDVTELVDTMNEIFSFYQQQLITLEKKEISVKETITNLSHDLRTPLTVIRGYTQILLNAEALDTEEKDMIEIINERVNALNILMDQLFEFARLEAGEIELSYSRVNLNAILRSVAVSFYQVFEDKGIVPELSIANEPFYFNGDEKAITRVFTNIVYNALTHGEGDYRIISYEEQEKYIFIFQNKAGDIAQSDIDKIFDRFYTTDKSRSKKTTGLGLTISKNLTLQMGGTIEADLEGAEFIIKVCFPVLS